MDDRSSSLEEKLTVTFGVIGLLAILVNLFVFEGVTWPSVLTSLKDVCELAVIVIVFLVTRKLLSTMKYGKFRKIFDSYLQDWAEKNRFLIDESQKTAGKEGKQFYYMLTKAHHTNFASEEKPAAEFPESSGTIYHKGAFIYSDYREAEEIIFGLNRSFFVSGRGEALPAPFEDLCQIAELVKARITEHFEGEFEFAEKGGTLGITTSKDGRRLALSLRNMKNTRSNAEVLIDIVEYVKTLIITIA